MATQRLTIDEYNRLNEQEKAEYIRGRALQLPFNLLGNITQRLDSVLPSSEDANERARAQELDLRRRTFNALRQNVGILGNRRYGDVADFAEQAADIEFLKSQYESPEQIAESRRQRSLERNLTRPELLFRPETLFSGDALPMTANTRALSTMPSELDIMQRGLNISQQMQEAQGGPAPTGILSPISADPTQNIFATGKGRGILGGTGEFKDKELQEAGFGKRFRGLLKNLGVVARDEPETFNQLGIALAGMSTRPNVGLQESLLLDQQNRAAMQIAALESLQAMQPETMSDEQKDWLTNERYYVQSKLGNLEGVLGLLEGGSDMISGPIVNAIRRIPFFGDIADGFIFQDAARVQQGVEQVLSENLREILGGQFAALEGFRYLERGYNPNLDEEENARRVRDLYNTIKRAYEAKEASLNPAYTGPSFEEIIADANQNYTRNYNWSNLEMKDELEAVGINREAWNNLGRERQDEFMDQYYIDLSTSYGLM